MALPSKNKRDADVDRLRRVVANLEKAAAPFLDGAAGFLSRQTPIGFWRRKTLPGSFARWRNSRKAKFWRAA